MDGASLFDVTIDVHTPPLMGGGYTDVISIPVNDPAIKAVNSGVNLPSTPITLAVRSDSSGTTQNFTLFLQDAVGSAWALGSSSTVKWPSTAHAASGNGGVATTIKSTAGAIGYVDYATAQASGLTGASVENKAGQFVAPSTTAASAAAAGVTVKPDLTFHAVWASTDPSAYPITYQSWDIVYAVQPNATDASLLKGYLGFLIGQQGQALNFWLRNALAGITDKSSAIAAATINGAWALRVADRKGSIEPGKDADLAVFQVEDYREIPYWFGANRCAMTVMNGAVAHQQ